MKGVYCLGVIILCLNCVCGEKFVPKWKKQACEIPASQNEASHYTCTDDGEVKCLPGWNGDLCDVPKCKSGCDPLLGYCNKPNECLCKLGYWGENCDKCIPLPGCQHGYCNKSFECICKEGWDGIFCNEQIKRLVKWEPPTDRQLPPHNQLEEPPVVLRPPPVEYPVWREPLEPSQHIRLILKPKISETQSFSKWPHHFETNNLKRVGPPPYFGPNRRQGSPLSLEYSNAVCKADCHLTRGYCEQPGECRCKLGWSGRTCRECQVMPGCVHGYCEKPLECKCHPGWTGVLCHIPLCSKTCHREHGYCRKPGECRCKVGWWGKNCEKCFPYPGCANGSCRYPWECICKKGWGGMLCDEELTYCSKNPDTCKNGAMCISLPKDEGQFRCLCREGTHGRNCEHTEYPTTPRNPFSVTKKHEPQVTIEEKKATTEENKETTEINRATTTKEDDEVMENKIEVKKVAEKNKEELDFTENMLISSLSTSKPLKNKVKRNNKKGVTKEQKN